MVSAEPLLIDTGKGFTIKYKGKFLYSSVSPLAAVQKRVSRISLTHQTLIFIPSLGLGYGLRELLLRLPPDCHILCIEADQYLMALAVQSRIVKLPEDPRITIIRTDKTAGAIKTLYSLGVWNFRRVETRYLCGGYHLNKEIYKKMQLALEEEVRTYWQNKITLINMSKLWMKNLFYNLKSTCGARDISSLITDKPIIVTGAGPSLEESFKWIEKVIGDVIILTVDTALPALLDAGIKPDYVFMLESQLINLQDFLPHHNSDITLICDITSNPLIIRLFRDNLYFYSSRFHPLKLFDRLISFGLLPASIPPLGSVGVASVHTALKITNGPVLFTGLDFSYIAEKTHARGTPVNRIMHFTSSRIKPAGMMSYEAIFKRPLLKLEGKDKSETISDLILRSYSLQLKKEISGTRRVFDMGRTGLPTNAPQIRSEAELLNVLRSVSAERCRKIENNFCPSLEAVKAFYETEMELLLHAEKQLEEDLSRRVSGKFTLSESTKEILKDIEYTVLHFPDLTPDLSASENFIPRVLASIHFFLSRLRRLESSILCGRA